MTITERSNLINKSHEPIVLNHPRPSYDNLLAAIGDARLVLIGDGTHGTAEFYQERAYITQRLIQQKGFNAVIVEADLPDAYQVNKYIHSVPGVSTTHDALKGFTRFPRWTWRNEVMVPFIKWMREHNAKTSPENRASFFGMDLYSLTTSASAVIDYLAKVDEKAAKLARQQYGIFLRFGPDTQSYSFCVTYGLVESAQAAVVEVLKDLMRKRLEYMQKNPRDGDEQFIAELNALVVKDAEEYYRMMLQEDVSSWNLRDTHMVDSIQRVMKHLSYSNKHCKAVVWAHNSHLGDARATSMGAQRGEINVGQLCRERFGDSSVYNIGFTTHSGSVTAAHEWDAPPVRLPVNPARPDSWEDQLSKGAPNDPNYVLIWNQIDGEGDNRRKSVLRPDLKRVLTDENLLERFIGVVYKPKTERYSHYTGAYLGNQFDAVVHLHKTRGIHPLDVVPGFEGSGEVPDTFPFAL